jgi:hypothetical protein
MQSDRTSLRAVAKKYGVPRSSLQFKIKNPGRKKTCGPSPVLSNEEENLPTGLAQSLPHSVLIGPFLQTSIPATLHNPSHFQHRHFSPEEGDSMLL